MIAVDAIDGVVPGLTHAVFLYRAGGPGCDHKNRPLDEKEGFRWPNSTGSASALAESGTVSVTMVADWDRADKTLSLALTVC
ncbi:MAG: hypothetical protein ABSA58_00375 [Acetobacteraceae bacterium]|jgi:hypothetical protein